MTTHADARARAEAAGQGHVFRFWNDLDDAGRARLGAAVAALDCDQVAELGALLSAPPAVEAQSELAPPELFRLERHASKEAEEARALGAELLGDGQVGYVLVAGGQASRLGYDGPKGAFPVGPVSGDPLFAVHARRLAAAQDQIASAESSAVKEVRDQAIAIAVAAAKDVIAKQMTAADGNKLIEDAISEVQAKLH